MFHIPLALTFKVSGIGVLSIVLAAAVGGVTSMEIPYDLVVAGLTFAVALSIQIAFDQYSLRKSITKNNRDTYVTRVIVGAIAEKVGVNTEKIEDKLKNEGLV